MVVSSHLAAHQLLSIYTMPENKYFGIVVPAQALPKKRAVGFILLSCLDLLKKF